eukprot:TRINITY_DN56699_c0_g1_i1.p1 TRINITY_DN56699_c0_g1~~TRINITY_DN56699_c0_g1_i1.p1  ORF type:complete len:100 (-),score=0.52 TRINITY_DN56699_c0_g1_i1:52-351(-)
MLQLAIRPLPRSDRTIWTLHGTILTGLITPLIVRLTCADRTINFVSRLRHSGTWYFLELLIICVVTCFLRYGRPMQFRVPILTFCLHRDIVDAWAGARW